MGDFTSKALNDKEAVVFVDVGGSIGIQCRGFKAKFPSIPGRVILQDMPETIEMVNKNPIEGVEAVARDFFTPQLIKGNPISLSCYIETVLTKLLKVPSFITIAISFSTTPISELSLYWRIFFQHLVLIL